MIDGKLTLKGMMKIKGKKPATVVEEVDHDFKSAQNFYNWMYTNTMTLSLFAKVADVLGCDVVLYDRETGLIYSNEHDPM